MRANAAVDADYKFVSCGRRFFERRLLDAVTFRETMRNMKASARA